MLRVGDATLHKIIVDSAYIIIISWLKVFSFFMGFGHWKKVSGTYVLQYVITYSCCALCYNLFMYRMN